jgi:4-oxalocrotonate tautomerase
MPHIVVKLVPGRSEQLKVQLVKDEVAVLRCGEDSVSVAIEDVKTEDWAERVYRPEILNHPELYKKPGYAMD